MRKLTVRQGLLGLLLIGGTTLLVRQISAQVPTVKGIGKVLEVVNLVDQAPSDALTVVYTVADDRTLVVTDVIITNATAAAGTLQIIDVTPGAGSATKLQAVPVAAEGSFDHSFGTGLEFAPGHELRVFAGPDADLEIMLTGYLRKG